MGEEDESSWIEMIWSLFTSLGIIIAGLVIVAALTIWSQLVVLVIAVGLLIRQN